MVMALIAFALVCGAVGVLFSAWRRTAPTPLLTSLGWLLLILSTACWSYQAGPEYGISFTLLTAALAAWAIILFTADNRPQKAKPLQPGKLRLARLRILGVQLWRVIAVVLLAGVVSVAVLVAAGKLLPLSNVNAMVLAALLSPVLWGAASYWLLADPRTARPPVILLLAGLVSGAVIML